MLSQRSVAQLNQSGHEFAVVDVLLPSVPSVVLLLTVTVLATLKGMPAAAGPRMDTVNRSWAVGPG